MKSTRVTFVAELERKHAVVPVVWTATGVE